ncbi:MAG: hypothetical protein ACK4NN_12585 [Rheinheimera sp.]
MQLLKDVEEAMAERDRRLADAQGANLLLSSAEEVLALSVRGVVTRFNYAAARVLSTAPAELQAKLMSDIFVDINPIEPEISFIRKKKISP